MLTWSEYRKEKAILYLHKEKLKEDSQKVEGDQLCLELLQAEYNSCELEEGYLKQQFWMPRAIGFMFILGFGTILTQVLRMLILP